MNYLVLKILTLMTMKRLNCSSGPWVFLSFSLTSCFLAVYDCCCFGYVTIGHVRLQRSGLFLLVQLLFTLVCLIVMFLDKEKVC